MLLRNLNLFKCISVFSGK